ncbi:DegT/DnrJ/EryC1/StrS family aminotransferase [Chloroflexi bacterium TSY]|nr:DegT/DnrJ/EryC1/StrS family aminotransferase [Chloroflexi bacterium TSY]
MAIALERNSPPVRAGDFGPQWDLGDEEIAELTDVIRAGKLGRLGGTKVDQFERDYAEMHGVKYAQAVTSGTAAVHTAIGVLDPNPGDEVITTSISDFGTIIGILYQNAIPVFADIDPVTGNLDIYDVAAKITDRTRAIVLVHLFGNPCDLEPYVELARKHDVFLIEDCAQAQLADYKGRLVGTWGDLGCFSFGGKHMTTGDGGMVISNRDDLAERLKWFTDKGNPRQPVYEHNYLAPNYRMTDLQGAVGIAQLKKVGEAVRRKQWAANQLNEVIESEEGLSMQTVLPEATHSYWAYGFHMDAATFGVSAKQFAEALQAEGVPANSPYLVYPMYKYPVLAERRTYGTSGFPWTNAQVGRELDYGSLSLAGSEKFLETTITLPMNPSYTAQDVEDFGVAIKKVGDYYRAKRNQK